MFKNFFIRTDVSKFNNYYVFLFYVTFSVIVAVLSYLYCSIYISKFNLSDSNNQIILRNLPFEYGELSHNIFYHSNFSFNADNIIHYLRRLLFFPILVVSLAKISTNIFFIFISKNFLLYSVLFYSILSTLKSLKTNLLLFLVLLIPF